MKKRFLKPTHIIVIMVLALGACSHQATPTPIFIQNTPTLISVSIPTVTYEEQSSIIAPVPGLTPTVEIIAQPPTNTPPQPESFEIELWHIQGGGGGPEYIDDSVKRFMKDNPNVSVTATLLQNDQFKIRVRDAMANGNLPCVFPSWGGGPMREYIQAGQIVDLSEMMRQNNYQDRFLEAAISNVTFDGKIFGVPVENTAIAVIFYNKAIFEKYGLTPPTTYNELLSIIDTLNRAGIAPFALANKNKWPGLMYYMYLVDRLGGPSIFTSAADRQGGSFQDPVFIQAGELLQKLVVRKAFNNDFNILNHDVGDSRGLLYSGKAAMELMGTWNIPLIKTENPDFYMNNLGFFPFPVIDGGKGNPDDLLGSVGDQFYHVSATCKHPQEAFKLIQYLIDDTAVAKRTSYDRIPPVKNVSTGDPMLQQVISLIQKAPHIQVWYDQYLPSEIGEDYKDVVQQLLNLRISPTVAAQFMERAVLLPPPPASGSMLHFILEGGKLAPSYDMGVDTSEGYKNWVTNDEEGMCMAYPSGQKWGAVFITLGKPSDPPRLGRDLSAYQKLHIELKGKSGNETILIGLKDNISPDNGTETKLRVSNLTTDWMIVEIPLSEFIGINLRRLYVVTELVFEEVAETVCVRNIQYLP